MDAGEDAMIETTKGFPLHTEDSAPAESKPILAGARDAFGAVPALYAVLAEAPEALAAYADLAGHVAASSLSPAEQQVVFLAAAYENECRYCVAAHTVLGGASGLTADQVEALRAGGPLAEDRLEALRWFAARVAAGRGWVHEDETTRFLEAGFTRRHALDVVLGVVTKALSNYVNHLADTPLDPFMRGAEWTPPREDAA